MNIRHSHQYFDIEELYRLQKSGTTLTRNVRFIDGSGWPHKSRGNVPKPEKKVQLMSASESSII